MVAMAGNSEAANFPTKVERGSFDAGDRASSAVGQVKEALEYKWALSASKKDTEVESYGSGKFLADAGPDEGDQKKAVGYSIPAGEEVVGAYAQKKTMAEESYGSGRFLLSCSMASTRAKKKRRSRATSKAPIKVFSTDASNFMAMVHKLTGIPSNTFPFYSPPPPPAASKLSPFTQGLPTLDTSSILLSCDRFPSGGAYSGLQALPSQQLFNSLGSEVKNSNQPGQSVPNIDSKSLSYSDLMRNMCSGSPSNLPHLWEASHLKHKTVPHKRQDNCISETEVNARHEVLQQAVTNESNSPISSNISSLQILLAARDKLTSTDAWVPSTSLLSSNVTKEEIL